MYNVSLRHPVRKNYISDVKAVKMSSHKAANNNDKELAGRIIALKMSRDGLNQENKSLTTKIINRLKMMTKFSSDNARKSFILKLKTYGTAGSCIQ